MVSLSLAAEAGVTTQKKDVRHKHPPENHPWYLTLFGSFFSDRTAPQQ
jgi:hypothetical protein